MANAIRVGIIGYGHWGPNLARNFHEMPQAELAWVSDLRAECLKRARDLYPDTHTTQDYHDVLASDVEAVVIATPVFAHHRLAMEALQAGKHILVEKPLAATSRQAMEIAQTADQLGLAAMVGHTFQYNPAVNAVRDLIARGDLGDIYYINGTRANLGLLQPDINVLWDLAPHDISILLHILGSEPVETITHGEIFVQKDQGLHEVAYMSLYFPGGVLANLRLSWLDPVKQRRITVVGSQKMLVYDDIADDKVVLYDKGVEVPPYTNTLEEFHMGYRHGPETVIEFEWEEPLRVECEMFVNWTCGGSRPPSDVWMGVKVVRVLEAVQESLLNGGGRVKVTV